MPFFDFIFKVNLDIKDKPFYAKSRIVVDEPDEDVWNIKTAMAKRLKVVIKLATGEEYICTHPHKEALDLSDEDVENLIVDYGRTFGDNHAIYVTIPVVEDDITEGVKKQRLILYGDSLRGSHILVKELD